MEETSSQPTPAQENSHDVPTAVSPEMSGDPVVQRSIDVLSRAKAEVAKVIVGQEKVVDYALMAIFTGNHLLIEGVPGVAKTLLVRTLAKVLGSDFGRIQFTPDLMPSDITGTNIFDLKQNQFNFVPGPLFTSFLLADEINRAPAKTQSALLQAMQERQVTIDGVTHELASDFTVFATQNPIEYEGTYPLPEAQKDRFLLRAVMDYPTEQEELTLANRLLGPESPEATVESDEVQAVLTQADIAAYRESLQKVTVRDELVQYVVHVVRKSRELESIQTGAGPRATKALLESSRAQAALAGRDYVTPDDVRDMAIPVLHHRISLRPEFEIEGVTLEEAIGSILSQVPVPR